MRMGIEIGNRVKMLDLYQGTKEAVVISSKDGILKVKDDFGNRYEFSEKEVESVEDGKLIDKYKVIGKCEIDENGEIVNLEREYFRQGFIYKNSNAYHNDKSAICYVPELSYSAYTGQDFLDMCNGQPEIADQVFAAVDWQHPETYLDEQGYDELWQCKCGKWYWCYGVDKCPYCGAEKKEDNYAG